MAPGDAAALVTAVCTAIAAVGGGIWGGRSVKRSAQHTEGEPDDELIHTVNHLAAQLGSQGRRLDDQQAQITMQAAQISALTAQNGEQQERITTLERIANAWRDFYSDLVANWSHFRQADKPPPPPHDGTR